MKSYHDIAGDGGSNIAAQVEAQAARTRQRLQTVDRIVAVMSGKGGVGKSSVTVNLAAVLALNGRRVGILDADVNGPSMTTMLGASPRAPVVHADGVEPAMGFLGIRVMAIDLFMKDREAPVVWQAPTQKDAYTWRTMMEMAALRELLSDTRWGTLDYLLIDLPPGSEKLSNLVDILPRFDGAIIVTVPSRVSQAIVGKSITMARQILKTPVVGLVENMAEIVCRHCGQSEPLFPGSDAKALADRHGVPYLGKIAFDPCLSVAADVGKPFVVEYPKSPAAAALRDIASRVEVFFECDSGGNCR